MQDSEVIETIVSYLRASERFSRPPATADTLDKFERKYQVVLPADMRRLYESVDGMTNDDLLYESLIRLLSISEIVPVRDFLGTEKLAPGDAFVFADHFIGADFFAIRLGQAEGQTPVFLAGDPPKVAARGFSEFLKKVLSGDGSLFGGESAV